MSYVLGVDLGTTTVAAATGDADRVETVSLGDRSVLAPAVVARRDDGALVTGDRAARRAVTEPERAAREVRRRLGDPTPVLLGERAEPATDLLAAMLRDVLDRAVAVRGARPARVVLAHPASWGPYRRGLLEDVAAAAGLPGAVLVPDPEAVVRQVAAARGLDAAAPTAVLDLGGTSCEAAVVRDGTVVGAPVAVERLGGTDLDEAVSAFVDEESGGLLAELDPEDPSSGPALARFRADCIAAKEALSVDDEVGVPLLLPGRHLDLRLSRTAFERRIAPVVARAVESLQQALDAASVNPEDLVAVLLVGGSARVPLLARAVREAVAAPVVVEARPDHVVALGAVRRGAALTTPADDDAEDRRTTLTRLRPPEDPGDRTTTVHVTGTGVGSSGASRVGGPPRTPGAPGLSPGPFPCPPAGPLARSLAGPLAGPTGAAAGRRAAGHRALPAAGRAATSHGTVPPPGPASTPQPGRARSGWTADGRAAPGRAAGCTVQRALPLPRRPGARVLASPRTTVRTPPDAAARRHRRPRRGGAGGGRGPPAGWLTPPHRRVRSPATQPLAPPGFSRRTDDPRSPP